MDDERLTARLRAVGTPGAVEPRPEFVDALHAHLASQLGFANVAAGSVAVGGRGRRVRRGRPWLLIAAAVALVVVLVANLATIGAVIERVLERPSVFDDVRSTGSLRVAIRPDDPQVVAPNGVLSGFDVDVADAIAARLGLRVDRVVVSVDEMLGEDPTWHLAMPSRALEPRGSASYAVSVPYYWWPSYLLARTSGSTDLAGATVCVVEGSDGATWAAGRTEVGEVVRRPHDAACLVDLRGGEVDLVISDRLLPIDVEGDPDVVIVGAEPVTQEARTILVPRRASDADDVIEAVDAALAGLRDDGSLTALSARRFGGEDLTIAP